MEPNQRRMVLVELRTYDGVPIEQRPHAWVEERATKGEPGGDWVCHYSGFHPFRATTLHEQEEEAQAAAERALTLWDAVRRLGACG